VSVTPVEAAGTAPAAEATDAGEPYLVTGVAPIVVTTAMRCAALARDRDEARRAKAKPLDVGFWDPLRDPLHLF
jgi:hypothetical protein